MAATSGLESLIGSRFYGQATGPAPVDRVGQLAATLWGAGHDALREAKIPIPGEVHQRLEAMAKLARQGEVSGRDLLSAIRNALYYDDFFVSFLSALEVWHEQHRSPNNDDTTTVQIAVGPGDDDAPVPEDDDAPRVARQVGPFKLLELIGRGGSGEVYKAKQAILNRVVAIKVLRAVFEAEESMIARFQNEAKAAAELTHPNIVRLIDMARCPDTGIYYIAFEYVTGSSLREILEERTTLPEREALPIILGVARALGCAAEKGIVHRDVKPANILIDEEGQPKLTDLGLAKRMDSNTRMTTMGLVMGTPHYIAPEQAMGEDVDVRTDLYSLGVTLFTCLTGRPPFKARTAIGVITQHVNLDVPDPRIFNPEISKDTVDLMRWLCARQPERRYPSAEEAVASIERVLADQRPLPPSTWPDDGHLDEPEVTQEEVARRMSHRSRFYGDGSQLLEGAERPKQGDSQPLPAQGPSLADKEREQRRQHKPPTMILSDDMLRAYRIARRLGRRAEGVVYEVEVLGQQAFEGFAEPVTMAVIKFGSEKELIDREGLLYADGDRRLVGLIDQGVHTNKRPYLVIERLFPHPATWFRRSEAQVTVDPGTAVDVFVNLLSALKGLHFRRKTPLVLCSVSPANIRLRMHCPAGSDLDDHAYIDRLARGRYEPVFAHVGYAQHRDAAQVDERLREAMLRDPSYFAPELATAGTVSTQSDLYGLTLTFYGMLTGLRPYEHTGVYQSDGETRRGELIRLKQEGAEPFALDSLHRRFGSAHVEAVEQVLRSGLDPDPATRLSTNALLRLCRQVFKVKDTGFEPLEAFDDPKVRLGMRQQLFPTLRRGTNAYKILDLDALDPGLLPDVEGDDEGL